MTSTAPTKVDNVRDHLANERTFLAWIRTSISIIIFGFVVAKFGITLREFLALQSRAVSESGFSLSMGLGFIVIGIFMALLAVIRYRIIMRQIDSNQFKPTNIIIVILGGFTAFFGAILTIYLILTSHTI